MLIRTTTPPPPGYIDPYDDLGALNAAARSMHREGAFTPPAQRLPVGYPRDVATDEAHLRSWREYIQRAREARINPRPRWHIKSLGYVWTARGDAARFLDLCAAARRAVASNRSYRRGVAAGRATP